VPPLPLLFVPLLSGNYFTETNPVVQPQFSNNEYFSNFYDAKNQNWSFKYESLQDAESLAANVALAKYYDNPKGNELISQDVFVPAKGPEVGDGDILGIRFVSHNLQAGVLNKVEDNTEQAQPKKCVFSNSADEAS